MKKIFNLILKNMMFIFLLGTTIFFYLEKDDLYIYSGILCIVFFIFPAFNKLINKIFGLKESNSYYEYDLFNFAGFWLSHAIKDKEEPRKRVEDYRWDEIIENPQTPEEIRHNEEYYYIRDYKYFKF